jgi:hypothetical protein
MLRVHQLRKLSKVTALDAAFIRPENHNLVPTLSNEPYYVSGAISKSLRLLSAIQLDSRLANRNILLAGPHPGSSLLLTEIAKTVAQETRSHMQLLDYQLICRIAKTFPLDDSYQSHWDLRLQNMKFSEGFSPGAFEISDSFDEEVDNEVDIDDDDLEEESTALHYRFPSYPRSKEPKIQLSVNVVPDTEKEGLDQKNYSISHISISNEAINSTEKKEGRVEVTAYDAKLSDQQISRFLDMLYNHIVSKVEKEAQRIIIYLKDVNDMVEGQNNDTGRKLIIGFTQLIQRLRSEKLSCVFMAGSSPSITDQKNITKDLEFYTQIIDGSAFTETDLRVKKNMAMDGTIFDTPLDDAKDQFEKVEILPPSVVYLSLQQSKSTSINRKEVIASQQKLRQYLSELEGDLRTRVGQVNCASIIDICEQKGIALDKGLLDVMKAGIKIMKGRKQNQSLIDVISTLTSHVWPLKKLERLVILAAGCQRELTNSTATDIGPKALIEALGIIYETDLSRFASMTDVERENRVSPAEIGGETAESKKAEAEPGFASAQTKQEPIISTPESLASDLKRRGIKLNSHEKRILSTVVDPGTLNSSRKHPCQFI